MVFVENIRRVNAHYQVYVNDNNEQIVYQKPYFKLSDGALTLMNTPVNPAQLKFDELSEFDKSKSYTGARFAKLKELVEKAGFKEFVQKFTRYQPLPEYKSRDSKEWDLLQRVLTKWISELSKPVLIVPLPLHHYVEDMSDYRDIAEKFNRIAGINGATLYDPLEDLKKYSREDRRNFRFEQDIHLTPPGHDAYAKLLAPIIRGLL